MTTTTASPDLTDAVLAVDLYHERQEIERHEARVTEHIESLAYRIRRGELDAKLDEYTALAGRMNTSGPGRIWAQLQTWIRDTLATAVADRRELLAIDAEHNPVFDVPKQTPIRLKGRIRSIRPGSNEHCISEEEAAILIAGGDGE